MKNSKSTIIDDVVLTESAISFLDGLQSGDNALLEDIRSEINEAISLMILLNDYALDDLKSEILKRVEYLNKFNRNLRSLMKP